MYRSHVGIPIDHENDHPSLFYKLDLVGKIGLENGDDEYSEQEEHQYHEATDANAMAGKWDDGTKKIERRKKVETLKVDQPKRR